MRYQHRCPKCSMTWGHTNCTANYVEETYCLVCAGHNKDARTILIQSHSVLEYEDDLQAFIVHTRAKAGL
jgi:hypothetical protein